MKTKLAEVRDEFNLTALQIAELTGVSTNTVNQYIRDGRGDGIANTVIAKIEGVKPALYSCFNARKMNFDERNIKTCCQMALVLDAEFTDTQRAIITIIAGE